MLKNETKTKRFLIVIPLFVMLLYASCDINPFDSEDDYEGPSLPTPVFPMTYEDPCWSADGQTIVFRRVKVTHVTSIGAYRFDPDSTGIWVINTDGTNMRLLLQGVNLYTPELSPDGKWLLFEAGAQIYKAPLVDGGVDTTNIIPLTTEGRNFFPTWSPDG